MTTASKPISFLNNILDSNRGIGEVIQHKVFDEYGQIILISLVVLLIILVIVLYKYTFSTFNKNKMTTLDYHKQLKLEKLPACSTIPEELQHRLCDYYIASSYNTPNIDNTQLDYVSAEMVAKALTSGARFIQLPICSYTVDQSSYPVICQSILGKKQITSLNTLSSREVFSTIRDFAFKYIDNMANTAGAGAGVDSYGPINYPLIIQLKLHTTNDADLDILHADITDLLGKYLLPSEQYKNYPIQLEKLCRLLNKIIIISTPGYEASKLNDIIIPTHKLFQKLDVTRLAIPELNNETIDKYFQSLTMAKQRASYKMADNIAPYLKQILDSGNAPAELESILNNESLTDKLTIYNMVAMTLIEPAVTETSAKNYNPIMPFTYGCQFVAMNYQTKDEYMDLYIKIFQRSSFILKPSGLRLPTLEAEVKTMLDDYSLTNTSNTGKVRLDPVFISANSDRPIILYEQASYRNKILSPASNNRISLLDAGDSNKLDNAFIVKISPLADKSNNLIMLVSASNPRLALTIPAGFTKSGGVNDIRLMELGNSMATQALQSFYPELPLQKSGPVSKNNISFRAYSTKPTDIYYLGTYRNNLVISAKTEDTELLTFKYTQMKGSEIIQLNNVVQGTLKVFTGGLVGLSQDLLLEDGSELVVIKLDDPGATSTRARSIALLDKKTNKYLSARIGTVLCDKDAKTPLTEPSIKFVLAIIDAETDAGDYTLMDSLGNYVIANKDGTLGLKKEREILSPAITAKDGNIIKSARVSPGLGSAKYFKVQTSWQY
jgi:hypothetical protein